MLYNPSLGKDSLNKNRNVISVMKEINNTLAFVHKNIDKKIDVARYEHATNYVNSYVSYTTIWNLKFSYNIESPEIALLQYLHLDYILKHQHNNQFQQERQIVETMYELFSQYKPFSNKQVENRKQQMYAYIEDQKKSTR